MVEPIYMLDTDTCIFILRRSSPALLKKIQAVPLRQQVISVVTYAELLYGVQEVVRKAESRKAVDAFVRHLDVCEWTMAVAEHYAEIRSVLKKKGQMIGVNDLFIAAHARSIGAIVVTNNEKDFGRVKGLKIENWT